MNETTKKYLAWLIVVVAILVAGYLGVTYPIPAPPVVDVGSQALVTGGLKCHSPNAAGDCVEVWNGGDIEVYSNQGTTSKFSVDGATGNTTVAGTAVISTSLKGTDIPMTGSTTRPLDFRSSPTTTSYLNTTMAYFRADLDKNLNEDVSGGNDGFTVGMFRGYVGATNMQGAIIEGLRAGVNLDAGALVNDPAGLGYIAGARITTYVPATANAKTNKGLIVAPRDDTAEAAISGSQYIGEQIYLAQATAKSESWGLDIYSESGSANYGAGINVRNGGSEQYGYGINLNDMNAPIYADIKQSNSNVIAATDGKVVYNTTHSVTIAEIKAGHTLVTVPAYLKFALVDVKAVAYGASCATVTTVDLLSSSTKLVTYAQTNLTQSTLLGMTDTGVTLLADGASFTAQAAGQDITVGQSGSDVATCTGVRFVLSYTLEE